jgi:hypothetical protein
MGKSFTIFVPNGSSPIIPSNRFVGGGISAVEIRRCFFGHPDDD